MRNGAADVMAVQHLKPRSLIKISGEYIIARIECTDAREARSLLESAMSCDSSTSQHNNSNALAASMLSEVLKS